MKFRILFLPFTLLFFLRSAGLSYGQADVKAADKLYEEMQYAKAIEAYKVLIDKKEPNLEVTQRIANGYRLLNNTKEAEFWYAQVLNFPDAASENILYYAEAAKRNGNYAKAKQLYLQYGNQVKSEATKAKELAAACDLAKQWLENPKKIEIKSETFNSENADFSPVIYKNGLAFTSDRVVKKEKSSDPEIFPWTGRPYLQLYTIEKDKSKNWGAATPMPVPVNSDFHNAAATFTKDGNTIYFTRTHKEQYRQRKVNTDPTSWVPKPKQNDLINRLEIYSSEFKNGVWSKPKAFAYNKPQTYSVGHPALSPDGQTLYFISDMPGEQGQTDLYYATKMRDGAWSKPVNCGPTVNSAGREAFPTVDEKGKLYFSSDGHTGMGGLDLFSAEGNQASWKDVTNMQAPLNSGGDDFGIIFEPNGENGYFSSNRTSDNGTDNIYFFKPYRVPCTLEGRTVEQAVSKLPLQEPKPVSNVQLKLYRKNDTTALVAYSDAQGKFSFPIEEGLTYTIKGSKPGYLTKSADVTPDCKSVLDMIKLDMIMNKNIINNSYIVENIYYDTDKADIRPDAAKELDKLAVMLNDNPDIRIELSSHTDSRQSTGYNQMLSQLRAESAVKYIISQGVNPKRITAKGYGETKLLNRCKDNVKCSDQEHQLNRRTEFKLIR